MSKIFRRGTSVVAAVVIVAQLLFVSGGAIRVFAEDNFDTTIVASEEPSDAQAPAEETAPIEGATPVVEEVPTEVPAATVAEAPAEAPAENPVEVVESAVPTPAVETAPTPDSVSAPVGEPMLTTDKDDYHPGETATIFGRFFGALEELVVKIFGSDPQDGNYVETEQVVTTDENGSFETDYQLDDVYRPFYDVVVRDSSGDELATAWFRDSAIGTYDQCSNDDGDGYATGNTGCRWINGNLQSSNSTYFEGDSTVQRLWIEGFAPNTSHTVTLKYGTTKGGNHAYDYLTNWNQSEGWATVADRCEGIAGCTTAAEATGAMQDDPNVTNTIEPSAASRLFTVRGATVTSVSVPTIVSGTYAGDSETSVTVTFQVNPSGSMCSVSHNVTSCGAVLWFGAHIAKTSEWQAFNGTTGAGSITGSPYHVALDKLDGDSVGSRDNQMQAGTIVILPTLTITKTVVGGTKVASDFQGKIDGTNVPWGIAQQVAIGSHTASEVTLANYTPSVWGGDCAANGSVSLTAGQNKTCTITNTYVPPKAKLTVVKTVVNDDGGTLQVSDFPLFVGATGVTSGVQNEFDPGTYAVSETSNPDYAASVWGGDCAADGSITLANGDVKTCTITNDDIDPVVHVIKHVINDNGGTLDAEDFTITVTNHEPVPSSFPGSEEGTDVVLGIGSYTVTEGEAPGYAATYSAGCSGTLGAGEEATCTITNDDIAPSLTLVKQVINDNGGTASSTSWTLIADGYDAQSPDAGTYDLSESGGPDGYLQTSLICDNAEGQVTSVTLGLDEDVTCTFVNDDQPSTLIVKKVVINDNGGSAEADDFSFSVSEGASVSFEADGQNDLTVDAGTYTVTETAATGYTTTYEGCDDVAVANGGTATCTITNDDQQAYITVTKVVNNNHGGIAFPDDFNLTLEDGVVTSGVAVAVNPGTYTAGETLLTGYAFDGFSGDCNEEGGVTVALGESKICTLTNSDIQPKLTVIKHVITDNGGTAVAGDFSLFVTGTNASPADFAGSETGVEVTLDAGEYSVGETAVSGYASSLSDDCTGTIAIGESKTCTITNDDLSAHLIVIKHVINDDGDEAVASDFTMTVTGANVSSASFPGSETGVEVILNAGAYTVDEATSAGYVKTLGTDCSGTIANGETKTCTITNNDKPHATRTQGFWQTHTVYTTAEFTGSSWTIGTHVVDTPAELFAGFYASLTKTSTGAKRSALDQARMQLLQQWLAAQLNCKAFGCSLAAQTLLTNAATAFGGTNKGSISTYASQLDAYNNSNDALPISGQGKATPSASQLLAGPQLSFWNVLP